MSVEATLRPLSAARHRRLTGCQQAAGFKVIPAGAVNVPQAYGCTKPLPVTAATEYLSLLFIWLTAFRAGLVQCALFGRWDFPTLG